MCAIQRKNIRHLVVTVHVKKYKVCVVKLITLWLKKNHLIGKFEWLYKFGPKLRKFYFQQHLLVGPSVTEIGFGMLQI